MKSYCDICGCDRAEVEFYAREQGIRNPQCCDDEKWLRNENDQYTGEWKEARNG